MLGAFSAVVFDMDGVLLDTEPLYRTAMQRACRDLGYEMADDLHAAQIGIPHDASTAIMYEAFGTDFPIDRYNDLTHEIMLDLTQAHMPVKTGVVEFLAALKAEEVPVAVATSTSSPLAPQRLRQAGIFGHFDAVVTRNDVTRGKPHPEVFLTAAARLGIPPKECIALEDSFNGIKAAHAAGMKVVMVPDMLDPVAEIEALCHAVLPSMKHVHHTLYPAHDILRKQA